MLVQAACCVPLQACRHTQHTPDRTHRAAAAMLLRQNPDIKTSPPPMRGCVMRSDGVTPLRLDPPHTPIDGEAEALALTQKENCKQISYNCLGCGARAFHSGQLEDASSPSLLHPTGWPTFVDHISDAVVLRSVLTADAAAEDHAAATIPVQKPSLRLFDVGSVRLDVSIASRGHSFEDRASSRTDISRFKKKWLKTPKGIHQRRLGILRSRFTSAAARKLREERRKVTQTHLQGHCRQCGKGLCIASTTRGRVRLVVNPSSVCCSVI